MGDTNGDEALVASVVSAARQAGLAGCEAMVHTTTSRSATWQTAAVTGAVVLGPRTSRTLNLRVFGADEQVGVHSARVSESEDPQRLVADAMTSMSHVPGAAPAPRLDVPTMGLGILDRRYSALTDEDRSAVVEQNVGGLGSVEGAEAALARYTEEFQTRTFLSSRGVGLSESGTRYAIKVVARLTKDASTQISGEVASRHFADVASIPLGVDLGNQIARYQNAAVFEAEALPVVMEPPLIAQLMHAVAPAFDGNRVAAGKSFITGASDQALGCSKLHMIDDAARSGGLATRGFDARGIPSMSIPLIREGQAGSLYLDVPAARARDSRPTGHQHISSSPWLGNLLLRSGNRSRNMIFPELGRFLMLDSSATPEVDIDLKTGDINLEAHCFLAEDGKRGPYVGVQVFETNFLTLWNAIQEIGSDQQRHGQVDVSTWILSGLPRTR